MKRASSAGGPGDEGEEGERDGRGPRVPARRRARARPRRRPRARPDADALFKSPDAKAKQASPGGNGATKSAKKLRGKVLPATTAARTKRKRSADAQKRLGEVQEDLDSNWAEGGMRIPKFVEPLRFRRVNEGMLLLGVIKEVREAEALVSLPNNLTRLGGGGAEVSDELSELIEAALEDEDAEGPGPRGLPARRHAGPLRCSRPRPSSRGSRAATTRTSPCR